MVHVERENSTQGRGLVRGYQHHVWDDFKPETAFDSEIQSSYADSIMKIVVRIVSGTDIHALDFNRDKHDVGKSSCSHDFAVVSLAGSREKVQPTEMLQLRVRKGGSRGSRVCTILLFALLFAVNGSASGSHVHHRHTGQTLSPDCWDTLQYDYYNQCPNRDVTGALDLEQIETLCCKPFGGKLRFHCQLIDNGNGTDTLFPACVGKQSIEMGKFGKLDVDSSDMPLMKQVPCEAGYFAPVNRSSLTEVYPHCPLTLTECSMQKGETVFCQGDAFADTRCRCKASYSPSAPDCDRAFDQHSVCKGSCVPDNTATYCEGTTTVPLCSSLSGDQFLISSNCSRPDASDAGSKHTAHTTTPWPPSTVTKQPSETIDDSGVTHQQPETPADSGSDGGLPQGRLAGIIVGILLILAAVVAAVIFHSKLVKWYEGIRDYFRNRASYDLAR